MERKYYICKTRALADLTRHLLLVGLAFGFILLVVRNQQQQQWWLRFLAVHVYALLQIRSFSILHDCAHNSYTPCKKTNHLIGWGMSLLTHRFFPAYKLRHLLHHQTNGLRHNTHDFPFNETVYHTVAQYKAMAPIQRSLYRFLRGPPLNLGVLLFGFLKFVVAEHFSFLRCARRHRLELLGSQVCFSLGSLFILALFAHLGLLFEYIFNLNIVAWLAFALVHNEHTFNPPYVVDANADAGNETKKWTICDSGLKGSSYIQIPPALWPLKYLFMGLEYHHIHHMNAQIPGYHLQRYAETFHLHDKRHHQLVKLSLRDCWHNLWLVLYDEDTRTYKTFAEADACY